MNEDATPKEVVVTDDTEPEGDAGDTTITDLPVSGNDTADIAAPGGVDFTTDDIPATELQAGQTLDEKNSEAAEAPIPLPDLLTALESYGFDPTSIEMLRERIDADDGSKLNSEEIAQLRQVYEINKRTQEIISGLDEENQTAVTDLMKKLKADKLNEGDPEAQADLEETIAKAVNGSFGEEDVNEMAAKILAGGEIVAGSFMKWLSEGIQSSDLTRLIDAIVMGADYNSSGAMSRAYEADGANKINVDDFFKNFSQKPDESLEKMLEIENDLSKALNWESSTLKKVKANATKEDKQKALKNYFLGMHQVIANASGAENILWSRASSLIAKKVFGDKAVISLEVLKELEKMSKDEKLANDRFTKTS